MQTVTLTGPQQREYAKTLIATAPDSAVVTVSEAKEARTKAQNRLVHKWLGDIERALVGQSFYDIKAECNLIYGRPILERDDPEWQSVFGYLFDALDHERKLKAIRVLDVPFTRRMNVKQLSEYMDQMQRDYAERGIYLTDPEARKYEGGA